MKRIQNLRVDYSGKILNIDKINKNPIDEFRKWFKEAQSNDILEPNAMTLSTISPKENINSRTVLLKGINNEGFIFYTNYESRKGNDINFNSTVSLVFLWKKLEKQIIIKGNAKKIGKKDSEKYFQSRPRSSRIAAWASNQSKELSFENELKDRFSHYEKKFRNKDIPLPEFWGGFLVEPKSIEFWIGRKSRMHDRILYTRNQKNWNIQKLYP